MTVDLFTYFLLPLQSLCKTIESAEDLSSDNRASNAPQRMRSPRIRTVHISTARIIMARTF
ncbi:hypothetical protein N7495_001954 [Penicillium taxi]|uniref:uncharacterized protein n=1 Tax=Penicillium taxi TaxID=168475 RepID=UPI0025456E7D|nr:uncharacterized protein N7495_001954 [Penicillium taxi]KAJ5909272.1 hypothetical protein N7495_001954 [Penicillium taxi]